MFTTISNAIINFIHDFAAPFLYFIKLSAACGNILVDIIGIILSSIIGTLIFAQEFCVVFSNDFTIFVFEFLQSIQASCSFLFEASWTFGKKIFGSFYNLYLFVLTVLQQIYLGFDATFNFCAYLIYEVWNLVILVFGGFTFIGSCVISTFVNTPKAIIEKVAETPAKVSIGISNFLHDLECTLNKIDVITTIDGSGIFAGLVGIIVCLISFTYYSEIINSFIIINRRIYTIVIDIVNQYWTGEFLESTNRNNLVFEQAIPGIGVEEPTMCLVCLSEPKNILYMPCRHCCTCKPCSIVMKARNCMLCRKRVRYTIEIYT